MDLIKVNKFFEDDRLVKHLNITIVEAGNSSAKCVMTIDDNLLNANDFVHGGALFSLGDFTFAVAANADRILTDKTDKVTVSHSAEIRYLKPAKSKVIIANAKCISINNNRSRFEVDIEDVEGNLVAVLMAKGALIKKPDKY